MKTITKLLVALVLISSCKQKDPNNYDVVIYGGTSTGISAAIQVSRMGKSVVIIEPTSRLGGLTTGGLGQTDIGNKHAIGGIAREFYQNIKTHYSKPQNWKWQQKEAYKDGGQTRTDANEDSMWTFEPSAALSVFQSMIEQENIKVVYNERLNRDTGVTKKGNQISSITMESGRTFSGKMFIDATYEGDLMATACVSYTVGRESNSAYGETLNGVQTEEKAFLLSGGEVATLSTNHNFDLAIDPYVIPRKPESGLLPHINPNSPEEEGAGDTKVQGYCFRMCLTDHPDNRIPFNKPEGYEESNYELLLRYYEAGFDRIPWINSTMPNRKTDTNNGRGFSTDFIGQNYNYPEATYEERNAIIQAHRTYQQGLMWTLANHERIPDSIRNEVARWGTCKDEFERKDGWQNQLYVREARRMISDYVMTQRNCEGLETVTDPVGLAAYGMDSHHMQRYLTKEGHVRNEGNVEVPVASPYPISYRSIVPKKEECGNLAVPICLSASHIAFGSIRMEPVFMVLGQSAATASVLAMEKNIPLQDVDYPELKSELLRDKQRLQ